jgi:AcrR family transcriptional regulator
MQVAARISERSLRSARARAEGEVRALLDAAFTVLGRAGLDGLTVAEVLAEAGLSTRAFYRHFPSKDALVLALFASESERVTRRRRLELDRIADPRAALDAWIEAVLALAYEPRRARRTRVLHAEGMRLRAEFPDEFGAILDDELAPLRRILERGREAGVFPDADPTSDALTVHAIVWRFAEARLAGTDLPIAAARAAIGRFVHRALGSDRRA